MNKGNPKIVVRLPPRLQELLTAEIARTNTNRRGPLFDQSSWLRQAILDKLKHSARARRASTGELAELDAFPRNGV